MKRTPTAALAAALGLASTASFAISGDAWYGTNQNSHLLRSAPVEVTRVDVVEQPVIQDGYVYYEALPVERPVIVQREYVVSEPQYVWVPRREDPAYDPLNPQTGQRIGRGLFNRTGPNDFGS